MTPMTARKTAADEDWFATFFGRSHRKSRVCDPLDPIGLMSRRIIDEGT